MECIFCKILSGEIPSRRVFENENFVAILDVFPASEGHTLVIPKKHFNNVFDIDEETIAEAYKIAKYVAEKIKQNLYIEDVNIVQNNGVFAGQTVNHFHIHVIPRRKNDTVTIKSEIVEITNDRLDEILNLLR